MCYFDQTVWSCGNWKWGNFRQQCTKEYRTGETCGLKLVYQTYRDPTKCKLCDQMDKKQRRVDKMCKDIDRWRREGNRPATVEKTMSDVQTLQLQIYDLSVQHAQKLSNFA